MDVQVNQEIETLQSNKTDIKNTKETLEVANTDICSTKKPLEIDNIETDTTDNRFETDSVDAEKVEEPVTNEDFEKENAEKSLKNDNADAENIDKRQKRYRSEKQRERTRQYKKKIRKLKRKMISEIRKGELCGSVSQIIDDTEASLIPSESENQFIKHDPLLKMNENFPASGKVSNLNASAEAFVPNKGISPKANISTVTNNDKVDKENGYDINTCEYGMKAQLAEQLEIVRQNRLREERIRAEKYNEIVRNMAAIIPLLTTHLMASYPSGRALMAPDPLPQGNMPFTVQTEAASPRYSQQRFEPNARRHCKEDNQTKPKGFVFLPSARNVPESLRISANSFVTANRHSMPNCHARTVRTNSFSRLKASAKEFKQQTPQERPVNNQTFEFSTDVFERSNLQDTEHAVQTFEERFLPFEPRYQEAGSEEFMPSLNISTSIGINAEHSVLDTRDPTLIYLGSRDITSLATAMKNPKQVFACRTRTETFSHGIREHQ